jgi:phosphoglycolate phosphatase
MYQHVIFDLDGTLIDSRADLAAAVNHMRSVIGLPVLPVATIAGYIGEGARVLVQRALGSAHADKLEQGLQHFLDYYGGHLLDHTRLYADIENLLATIAAATISQSVLTNKPEALSRAILEGLGVLHYFAAVVGGDSLSVRKPDPGGVAYLSELTATPRERMLLVGDSPIDLQTARAAGVAFCGVAWGIKPATRRAAKPDQFIERPMHLLAVLQGARRRL